MNDILQRINYVDGVSNWGNSVVMAINPCVKTFKCGAILRDKFYTSPPWSYQLCDSYSIFAMMSYPIKGFHILLDILPDIIKVYPKTKIYVAGGDFTYRKYGLIKSILLNN